jgi:hypothetical protein
VQSGKNSPILTETLTWLVPMMPDLVLNIVKQMKIIDFDWLAIAFEAHPQLLLSCLEERAEDEQKVTIFRF